MAEVFISYARSTAGQAEKVAQALRELGHDVWRDDQLPAHRPYADVIEERLRAAKAVLVLWSAEAVKSQWVRAEAEVGREAGTLVQASLDGTSPPLPFSQIQCAVLSGPAPGKETAGWRSILASLSELLGKAQDAELLALSLPDKASIAVMPFANLSSDAQQAYFVDAMVEEIVGALARFKSIFVVAAASSLSFKGQVISPRDAARKLGVRYVLEGSVRRSAERVRIAVNLSDAASGVQIWADRFDDTLNDIFALQDRVALSVAGVIEPTVLASEHQRSCSRPTKSLTSYELFLRAWRLSVDFSREGVLEAIDLLDKAIAADPVHARAMGLAAVCHGQVFAFSWAEGLDQHRQRGHELARRALQLGGDDPEILAWVAITYYNLKGDMAAAVSLIEQALKLNPGSAYVWLVSGWVHSEVGATDIAVENFQNAMRLDPLSTTRHLQLAGLGAARLRQHRLDDAIAAFKEAAALRPSFPMNHAMLAACYAHIGELTAGREAIRQFEEVAGMPIQDWAVTSGVGRFVSKGIALLRPGNAPA